jgi:predicted metal-binding protein
LRIEHLKTLTERVDPVIIHPCGFMPTCLICLHPCWSPIELCKMPYYDKPDGCPNYGKRPDCPPNTPFFDEVYDTDDVIFVGCQFDFKNYLEGMKQKHPTWSDRQLRNVIYWQGQAKKVLTAEIEKRLPYFRGFQICFNPEAMGVSIAETCRRMGVNLEFPPINKVWKIALLAKTKNP